MKTRLLYTFLLTGLTLTACNNEPVPNEVNLKVEQVDTSGGVHTEEQLKILNSDDPDKIMGNNTIYYGLTSNSKPKPLSFSWKEENDINVPASRYEVVISEYQDMYNATTYVSNEEKLDIYNLKINTDYYYHVDSYHGKASFKSDIKSFRINDKAPRNIYVDGIENVRDLGGWNIGEGKTYKQGMIYRTIQFNYGPGSSYKYAPTPKGFDTLKNELRIKTEIDLRRTTVFDGYDEVKGITSSPIGKEVNYVSCPMIYDNVNPFTRSKNKASMKLFFDTLSDINNYPIAFHCLRGTDRTGALAYILGALVGMSEEDLMMDYLFSNLANINGLVREATISGDDFYVKGIASSEGSSYSEKAKNYLMSTCEIRESVINQVIDNLTD